MTLRLLTAEKAALAQSIAVAAVSLFVAFSILTYYDRLSQYFTQDQDLTLGRINSFLEDRNQPIIATGSNLSDIIVGLPAKRLRGWLDSHFKQGDHIIGNIYYTRMLPVAFVQVTIALLLLAGCVFLLANLSDWRLKQDYLYYLLSLAVVFHVMNYLTKTGDMVAGFGNAVNYLRPNGLFIFDSWYGPAVLSDLPEVGVRRFENDRIEVSRLAEPTLHPKRNVVDVNYEIIVQEKDGANVVVIKETHIVRYFFETEIEELLETLGVGILATEEWVSGKTPGLDTFSVCFVGKK